MLLSCLRASDASQARDRQEHGRVAMNALKDEQINKVSLIAFTKNDRGNAFWKTIGWTKREDLNYYDFTLNEENIVKFNE